MIKAIGRTERSLLLNGMNREREKYVRNKKKYDHHNKVGHHFRVLFWSPKSFGQILGCCFGRPISCLPALLFFSSLKAHSGIQHFLVRPHKFAQQSARRFLSASSLFLLALCLLTLPFSFRLHRHVPLCALKFLEFH